MATRQAITKTQATRYRSGSRAVKSEILDAVCAVTGLNRDYARRALKQALRPRVVRPRPPRSPKYDSKVVAALEKCWAVENAPAGKRLAPILAELVPVLRRYGELDIDEAPRPCWSGCPPRRSTGDCAGSVALGSQGSFAHQAWFAVEVPDTHADLGR